MCVSEGSGWQDCGSLSEPKGPAEFPARPLVQCAERSLPGVVATVIIADSVSVGGFVVAALVKLGGIPNLVLCQIDVDLPSVVDAIDGAGRQSTFLPKIHGPVSTTM